MTRALHQRIDHPSAWTRDSSGGKAGLTWTLTAAEHAAIEEMVARTRAMRPQAMRREDADAPALVDLARRLKRELMDGRSVVILSGLTPERYSADAFERVFWALGLHMGIAAVQSRDGDRLGYVQKDDVNATARGYRSQAELAFHTDSYEILGLMCVRAAASGGYTSLVSTLAIHNALLAERPELLDPLYRGYYYALSELQDSHDPVTAAKIPVYCNVDGVVSAMYSRVPMEAAARLRGEPLPDDLRAALDAFDAAARRPDLAIQFLVEPGEMLFVHNFVNMHARTTFEDSPDRKRLLFRLWLTVPDGRPVDPAIYQRGAAYDRAYRELGVE